MITRQLAVAVARAEAARRNNRPLGGWKPHLRMHVYFNPTWHMSVVGITQYCYDPFGNELEHELCAYWEQIPPEGWRMIYTRGFNYE